MKNILLTLLALAVLTLSSGYSQTVAPKARFSSGGTAVGTTLSYAVVSALSANGGTPLVHYIAADSDLATSRLLFYTVTAPTSANYVSTTTSLPVALTNGFTSGDIIVIRHQGTDTYERRVLTTFTSATNLTVTVAPTVALAIGDQVYDATVAGIIPWGGAGGAGGATGTNILSAVGGIYSGQPGMPLLMDLNCTSLGHISAVQASYLPVPNP